MTTVRPASAVQTSTAPATTPPPAPIGAAPQRVLPFRDLLLGTSDDTRALHARPVAPAPTDPGARVATARSRVSPAPTDVRAPRGLAPDPRRRHPTTPPEGASCSPPVATPFAPAPPHFNPPQARAAVSLEDLLPALVRRIAWSGDRSRGSVRLVIGAGELAGATLSVHAQGGLVRVQMEVPAGVDALGWRRRILDGLASGGVPTDDVEVT